MLVKNNSLSARAGHPPANLALLRGRDWIDLPFLYETGQRAVLTFEKVRPASACSRRRWLPGRPVEEIATARRCDLCAGPFGRQTPARRQTPLARLYR